MEIMTVGLDCKIAPLDIREKLSFVNERIPEALRVLVSRPFINEAVILSTCNRVELYVLSAHTSRADTHEELRRFLADFHGIPEYAFEHLLYYYYGRDAVKHLFEVASGIQSMVLGEPQIQGQVREAAEIARQTGTAGRVMDAFFRAAIATGKRARTETAIGENGVSVSFNAVELLRQKVGSLNEKVGLVVGSGQTARLTAQIMLSNKVNDLIIVNRNLEKGRDLAEQLGTDPRQVYPLPRLQQALAQTDLVVSCTGAPHAVIQSTDTAHAMTRRAERPLYMVDIAVPRDIDPQVREIPGVFAWDIDDIKKISEENLDKRRSEVHHVQGIVLEEVEDFMRWLGTLAVVPTITTLRRHAEEIRKAELERVRNAFGELTEKQTALLDELTNRIVNKLLHGPTTRLKEAASARDASRYAEVIQYLFELRESGNEAN